MCYYLKCGYLLCDLPRGFKTRVKHRATPITQLHNYPRGNKMGKKVEIMGKTYKAKKLNKKAIEKLVAAQRADERKKQGKKLKKQLRRERKKADKDMATLLNRMSKALAPIESPDARSEQTPS
jgi:hypothetical protein